MGWFLEGCARMLPDEMTEGMLDEGLKMACITHVLMCNPFPYNTSESHLTEAALLLESPNEDKVKTPKGYVFIFKTLSGMTYWYSKSRLPKEREQISGAS
jgi:hypothetical protein